MDKTMLVGATGMVGSAVIANAGTGDLTLLARRAVDNVPPAFAQVVTAPDDWPAKIEAEAPTVLLSCLGTTIGQAGSQAAFRAVDYNLVLAVAGAAKAAGARHFIAVSSVGASAKSGNFYLRTKGEAEDGLRALGFERLDILRPGLLTGQRGGPWRAGESVAMALAPLTDALLLGSARRYRSVPAAAVARAMIKLAEAGGTGAHVHEHDAIMALAD